MTEAEWLVCTDPTRMLEFLRDKASDRKLRLLGCACCRRIRPLLEGEWNCKAIELVERYSDQKMPPHQREGLFFQLWNGGGPGSVQHPLSPASLALRAACEAVQYTSWANGCESAFWAARKAAEAVAVSFADVVVNGRHYIHETKQLTKFTEESAQQADLLRCIFGNPFRSIALDSSWLSDTEKALAQHSYGERRFEDLPILADALEEAGCTYAEILGHLRGPGPHVRGCWALDLILGKS